MYRPAIKAIQRRKKNGFTLTELLIVIVIAGILASVAVPSYSAFVAGQRIKSASFDMLAMLTLLRSEAIKRGVRVTSAPTNSDWSYGWTITAADGTVLSQQSRLPGITVTCMQASSLAATACSSLSFTPNGRSQSAQLIQITAATGSEARCIGIDLSGRPNSKKGNCR